jgi:hypothetical protein
MATVAQRLDEWCCDASHKAGGKRQTLAGTTCFLPLLRWIVALGSETQLALALAATSWGARFVVLPIRVVYRGGAIPVAGTVLPAHQPGAWRREWLRLLRRGRPAIPPAWTVLVLADRGLWARWLFQRMVRLGWHPLLRSNQGAKFCPAGQPRGYWLRELGREVGQRWRGRGPAFVSAARRLDCPLVAWGARATRPYGLCGPTWRPRAVRPPGRGCGAGVNQAASVSSAVAGRGHRPR